MRVYVAGPMSNIPQMNFPAFDAASATLRARGYEVVNPAELDDPQDRAMALASVDGNLAQSHPDKTWGFFLARDVKLIADDGIEGIYVLEGWQRSRGARLETFVGSAMCGLPIFDFETEERIGALNLVAAWAGGMWAEVMESIKNLILAQVRGAFGVQP